MSLLPPTPTLFPYTTLFRSLQPEPAVRRVREIGDHGPICATLRCPPGRQERSEETRLNSSHVANSYAVFCLKKKNGITNSMTSAVRTAPPSTVGTHNARGR